MFAPSVAAHVNLRRIPIGDLFPSRWMEKVAHVGTDSAGAGHELSRMAECCTGREFGNLRAWGDTDARADGKDSGSIAEGARGYAADGGSSPADQE
jgi:hypothetical protein